jgi:hypothetical protein
LVGQLTTYPLIAYDEVVGDDSVSNKYLLPCRCGQQFVVEPRRAGETIACSCGAALQIPTMLEMAALEPSPEASIVPAYRTDWNWRRGMLLLGGVFVLMGMCGGASLYWFVRPTPPIDALVPEQVRESAKRLPPAQTWAIWENMKQGLDPRVDKNYAAALSNYQGLLTIDVVVALIGVALIVVGATAGRRADGR